MCLVGRLPTFDMPEERWEAWWTPGNKDDKASSSAPGWDSVCILGLCTTGSPSRYSVEEEEKYRQKYLVRTEKEKQLNVYKKKKRLEHLPELVKDFNCHHLVVKTSVFVFLHSPFCSVQLLWCVNFNRKPIYGHQLLSCTSICNDNLLHIWNIRSWGKEWNHEYSIMEMEMEKNFLSLEKGSSKVFKSQ